MPLDDILRAQLPTCLTQTDLSDFGTRYQGKVRDTYTTPDGRYILVTTDRISAFDHILRQAIPFKGQVLNQLSAHFFEATADITRNHILAIPDPNVTLARRCDVLPIEFVVRGYLAGHAWRVYREGGRILCGQSLPDGLRQNSRLPHPILTPATKATSGHDEDISRAEIVKRGLLTAERLDELETTALRLFARGTELAARHNLILVDTKYEFGLDEHDQVVLVDEVHTPDSSRYFYADSYDNLLARDEPQRQLSKEFVREWLMDHGFQGLEGQTLPDLPDDFRIQISRRYIELFEGITGRAFEPAAHANPEERIRRNLKASI